MIKREDLITFGTFNKPHGLQGEIAFSFTDDVLERGDSTYIVCSIDGIFVPFFIEEYRYRSENSGLMKLKNIDSDVKAKFLFNKEIFYPKANLPDADGSISESELFIGYTIIDKNQGEIGVIKEIEDSTINVLFVVRKKKDEFLIPASDEYVCEIDDIDKTILMDLPEGLLDSQKDGFDNWEE